MNVFSRSILGEKYPKCGSGGRKSTYCEATYFQPTAQQVKSGLNLLSMLLIHQKYIDQVEKPPRRCFSASVWAKKIRNVDPGNENLHIVIRRFPTYRSTSQIQFKSSPIDSDS